MQLLAWRRNSQVKIIAAWLVFVMAVALMGISPVTDDNNLSAGSLKNLAIVSYSALEMDLAKEIHRLYLESVSAKSIKNCQTCTVRIGRYLGSWRGPSCAFCWHAYLNRCDSR
jgi:hypothetical protein